jgi:hypothetical protein
MIALHWLANAFDSCLADKFSRSTAIDHARTREGTHMCRLRFSLLLMAALLLSACSASRPAPASSTSSPGPSPTLTSRPTKTAAPSATPSPTLITLAAPRLEELSRQGFRPAEELYPWVITASTSSTTFGGPSFLNPIPPQISIVHRQGLIYTYAQYNSETNGNCRLLFFVTESGQTTLIAEFEAASYGVPVDFLTCSPIGWGDLNQNDRPDFTMAFDWGVQYTGSEARVYEMSAEGIVIELTRDLPGILSPWDFNPDRTEFPVFDKTWAEHDCIYPPLYVFWVYDWDGEKYVDITPEVDLSGYYNYLSEQLADDYGSPLVPQIHIGPLTTLLVMHEKNGQRSQGWAEYLKLAASDHWPGTSAESLEWLQSDLDHFRQQYESGTPFSPNDYCGF